jgi:hypothetical protein
MRFAAAVVVLASVSAPVAAQESPLLVLGGGASGFWHHNSHVKNTVATGSVEYRSASDLSSRYELLKDIKPLIGAFAMSDDTVYIHAGVYRDFPLARRWILTPHFSAGLYSKGDKNDLGGILEFQSGFDLFYRLDHGWRLGATLRHVSNGGIYGINPGIETLAVVVSVPLR